MGTLFNMFVDFDNAVLYAIIYPHAYILTALSFHFTQTN